MAPDCVERQTELDEAQTSVSLRRPHGLWHYRSYFTILAKTVVELRNVGITVERVTQAQSQTPTKSFQSVAESMIADKFSVPYFPLSRIRAKIYRWRLGVGDLIDRRVQRNFLLLSTWCQPRILSVYLRTLWNGWVTDRRFANLRQAHGVQCRTCLLCCGTGEDSVDHYSCCSVFWQFAHLARPRGLGLRPDLRGKDVFLLIREGLTDIEKVRIALGIYAVYRTVNHMRHADNPGQHDFTAMLSLFAKRGADGSKAKQSLRF